MHGAFASLETVHPFIRGFARDHLVVAPDSRAQGRSTDGDGPLTYDRMGADMIALLDALHLQSVDVIGWSDGGIIGLDMAIKHPDRVRRLIAIGANLSPEGLVPETFGAASVNGIADQAKTLIVVGEQDVVLAAHTDLIVRSIPGAEKRIVPGATHGGPLELPGTYVRIARDFLARD